MKRRALLTILVILIPISGLLAYQDSFSYLWDDETYTALISALKNDRDEDEVLPLYEAFMASDAAQSDKSRIEYHMVRYYADRGDEEEAEAHLENEKRLLDGIPESESALARDLAELDKISADYYIGGKLSVGLDSSNKTKQLYKAYPDEYYVALTEAFRLLNTPGIAGGSSKKALELFEEIYLEEDGMNPLDRFSLFSGLGMASYERKLYELSKDYFERAMEIYKADPAMLEYLEKLEKKLR